MKPETKPEDFNAYINRRQKTGNFDRRQEILRWIVDCYLGGQSPKQIATSLNHNKVRI